MYLLTHKICTYNQCTFKLFGELENNWGNPTIPNCVKPLAYGCSSPATKELHMLAVPSFDHFRPLLP